MTRGCPFGTIGNEVTENDELIRQDLSLIFEVAKGKIATFFVREKASGRLDPQVREDEVADYCLAMIQGAMLLGKVLCLFPSVHRDSAGDGANHPVALREEVQLARTVHGQAQVHAAGRGKRRSAG